MSIGIWQVLLIVFLVLLLFGAGRLPRIMEDLGKGVTSFKRGLKDDQKSVEDKSKDGQN
jgi:sec-independent protein translocase protein TatA